jgi:hypothetical protein
MIRSGGGENKQKGMKRRWKNEGGGRGGSIIKTKIKCFHAYSSCFPMESRPPAALHGSLQREQMSLAGSEIDNLCLLSYTS